MAARALRLPPNLGPFASPPAPAFLSPFPLSCGFCATLSSTASLYSASNRFNNSSSVSGLFRAASSAGGAKKSTRDSERMESTRASRARSADVRRGPRPRPRGRKGLPWRFRRTGGFFSWCWVFGGAEGARGTSSSLPWPAAVVVAWGFDAGAGCCVSFFSAVVVALLVSVLEV